MGLSYTAIEFAHTAARFTIELDLAVVEIARQKPYSRAYSTTPNRTASRHSYEEIETF